MTTPDPYRVELHLTATEPGLWIHGSRTRLYQRTWRTAHLPPVGGDILLWEHPEDGGPSWQIRSVHWNSTGTPELTLVSMIVDPTEEMEPYINQWLQRRPCPYAAPWRSNVEGHLPYEALEQGGWTLQ